MIPPEALHPYFTVLSFLFGAAIGSFLNVCIYRIPLEQSVVRPPSHCFSCQRRVAWYDNIPLVSYLVLRGRCRYCKSPYSPRYLLVELLTAVLFLLIWLQYGGSAEAVALDPRIPVYWLFVSGLLLGTFVDFDHQIIPDRVSIGGMMAGVGLSLLAPSVHDAAGPVEGLIRSLIGCAAGFGSLYLIAEIGGVIFKKEAMGFGDVKLLGAIGAFLGWKAVLFTILMSSLIGSVVGVSLILLGGREWQSRIPYGPYLAAAAVVWVLWGQGWWDWYFAFLRNTPI
jgi:leader peptidase (prepilin peptidase) / N-methyltransferase